jgi:acyl-CoA dehydrogenase
MLGFDLSEEQQALVETARKFARERIAPIAPACDADERFPDDVFRDAWELGLVNCEVPESCGGLGLGCLEQSLIFEELYWGCAGITTSMGGNALAATPLILAASEEIKREYLGRLVAKPVMAAYACSEPDAGSDVAAMTTRYRRDGDSFVLDGQKRWITNGGLADWYVLFATSDKALRHKGISCFVVDRDTPGVKVGRKEEKMGQRASNTTDVILEDVRVPARNLVGREGEGFKIAMRTFDRTRPWIAAGCAGVIRRAMDESRRYALERKAFGVPIAQHQAVQFMLAEMAIAHETTRLLMLKAAWQVDRGAPDSIVSAYAKAYGADAAMRVTTDAVQVFGGYGYIKEYPVEKLMRDAKLFQIYEGTSQIQRVVIARRMLAAE